MPSQRKSLLNSSLRASPVRLLPGEIYPAVAIEKALVWQEEFSNALSVRPTFGVATFSRSGESKYLSESLDVQSYRSFARCSSDTHSGADYVVLLGPGMILHPSALFLFAKTALTQPFDLLYANEFTFSSDMRSIRTFERRGEIDPYSILARNTVGSALVLSAPFFEKLIAEKSLADIPGVLHPWAIALEAISQGVRIHHLPLLAFAVAEESSEIPEHKQELAKVLKRYGERMNIPLESISILADDTIVSQPRLRKSSGAIQVVVPFRDQAEFTVQCLRSLERQDCASDLEVTLVNNSSTAQAREDVSKFLRHSLFAETGCIIDDPQYFNYARLNNVGAAESTTPFILFLNNDVEITGVSAITELRNWCALADVGAVGGVLKYSDGRIQSAGISFAAVRPKNISERSEFAQVLREVDGVTFAMAMVKREAFRTVGGLDELRCPNGFGDVLFCRELRKCGYRILLAPTAEAVHHESASRGRIPEEIELLELVEGDVPIPFLYDDLSAERQPMRFGSEVFAEQPFFKLARGITRSPKIMNIANRVASAVLRSRDAFRPRY